MTFFCSYLTPIGFLKKYNPVCSDEKPKKRIGRPPKKRLPQQQNDSPRQDTSLTSAPSSTESTSESMPTNTVDTQTSSETVDLTDSSLTNRSDEPPVKKKRGHYRAYSLQFKMAVVEELAYNSSVAVAEKYSLPRSTLYSWETQLRRMNPSVTISKHTRGLHLNPGSGRPLSYPKEIDEEIMEWILTRRDKHQPVGREMIKIKARQLVKPHKPEFTASTGWLHKFMLRNGLSL